MIRIRHANGSVVTVDSSAVAVELCSSDGLLAAVLVQDGAGVHIYERGDSEFEVYRKGTGMAAANRIHIDGGD